MSAASVPALELRDVRKSFGKTEIIRGANLAVNAGRAGRHHRAQRRRQVTLFNLISGRFAPTSGDILLNGAAHRRPASLTRSTAWAWRAASRSATCSRACRCSRTCAAPCSGTWATATRSGASWPTCATPTTAPTRCCEMIKLDKRRDVLAMNLTYAEQRALEIGITIAGGAERDPARRAHRRHEPSETSRFVEPDPRRDGRQDAADRRARHGRGVRPGRQDRRAGLRRGDRLRRARGGARQSARAGGLPGLGAGRRSRRPRPAIEARAHAEAAQPARLSTARAMCCTA